MVHKLTSKQNTISWIAQVIAAIIMFQTLFFKFSGAEESVYIFTRVGMEPWGRYGSGIAELIASILLLTPTLSWAGAIIGAGVMSGALFFHLTVLGISVKDDGGYLFALAIVTFIACLTILYLRKHQIPYLNKYFSSLA
jgi:putative oxidoreductase